ncbi:zf-MYND-domain-containing protein [Lentinus brumalis]|uniref:Zf-MYND-domain-containing protein n=1 Tax=Lentinus brumalis TaxID=2498619 RepID=A0A371DK02_9APHY|nr:zf-MYND-domain-containing protein [Polyporus brumalis]
MPIDTQPMQTVFRGADGEKLRVRNKDALCRQCDRAAAKGERFRKCTGCKMTIYCSEECQRAAWPNHKDICHFMQTDSGWPIFDAIAEAAQNEGDLEALAEMEQRQVLQALIRDFVEAHRPTLWAYMNSKMYLDGGVENFFAEGKETRVLLIAMKYNPPGPGQVVTDIDPARAFRVRTCAFIPLTRLVADYPQLGALWESSASYRQRLKDKDRGNPLWAGVLMVLFQAVPTTMKVECFSMFKQPNSQSSPAEERILMQRDTKVMNLGIVFRPQNVGDKHMVPGYLDKQGSVWKWRPLVKDPERDPEWVAATGTNKLPLMERRLKAIRKS